MKPWYPQDAAFAADPRYHQIIALAGPWGFVALVTLRAWGGQTVAAFIPDEQVDPELAHAEVPARMRARALGALVSVGYLARQEGGYELLEFSPSARSRETVEATASGNGRPRADRRDRYRQEHAEEVRAKDRARKASRKASSRASGGVVDSTTLSATFHDAVPRHSTTLSTTLSATAGVAESDHSATFRDTPAPSPAPPDPPPTHAPTPAQAQAQAQAHEGRASAPAMGEFLGEEYPRLEDPKPDAVAPKAPKAKAKRALPTRSNLAQAYAAGISAATGAPYSPPSKTWDRADLDAAAATHGAGRVGAELLGWLEGEARTFARVASPFVAGRGYRVDDFGSWLNSGRLGAPRADIDAQPPPRLGPIDRGPRAPTGPLAAIPEGTSGVEIAAAVGLFAPKLRTAEELQAAIRDEIDRQTPRPASPRRPPSVVRTPEQAEEARRRALAQLEAARRQHETAHPETEAAQ